jgi:hypothetical protein
LFNLKIRLHKYKCLLIKFKIINIFINSANIELKELTEGFDGFGPGTRGTFVFPGRGCLSRDSANPCRVDYPRAKPLPLPLALLILSVGSIVTITVKLIYDFQ